MITANFSAYGTYITDSLHQWDLNQVLRVTGVNLASAPEVHFSNANTDRAIVRQATMENHIISVNIPNSLLQDPLRILAHIGTYEGSTFKVVETVHIPVTARKRPMDYQIEDTDEEVYSFKRLENMIGNMVTQTQFANLVGGVSPIDADGNVPEIVDVRYGADGVTYASAGEAVREQFNTMNSAAGVLWTEGGFINVYGTLVPGDERYYTNFIPCGPGVTIVYRAETDHASVSALTCYDRDKNAIATNVNIGAVNTDYTFTTPENTCFVRLSSKKNYDRKVSFSTVALDPIMENLVGNSRPAKVYVSTTGNDKHNGSKEAPFLTIAHALETNAETIYVEAGTYNERVLLTDRKVEIIAYNGAVTLAPSEGTIFVAYDCDLKLVGIIANGSGVNGFSLTRCTGEVVNCAASANTSRGFLLDGSKLTLKNCTASNNGSDGFNAHDTETTNSDVIFFDCIADGNGDDGLSFHENGKIHVFGGRYANNRAGGITPYGQCVAEVKNALIEKNAIGLYAFQSTDGGIGANPTIMSFGNLIRQNTVGIRADYYDIISVNDKLIDNESPTHEANGTITIY